MKVQFARINFLLETVNRFRIFSKKHERTHSDVLEGMMDFFEKYQLSPFQDFGPTLWDMEANIKRRINSMIGIIKDIEKHQTKPTTAMLELLFEHSPRKKSRQPPLLMEGQEDNPERDAFFQKIEEAIVLKRQHTNLQRDLYQKKSEMMALVKKIHLVKSSFGKPKLQLDMTPEEFEQLKMKLKTE